MVIHRAGSAPNKPTPRERLGCVLVTIDDLDALMQLLGPHQTDEEPLRVRFSGGLFTEANDLRSLSDQELSRLTVVSGPVSVELAPSFASVVTENEELRAVVKTWSKDRATNVRPLGMKSRRAESVEVWIPPVVMAVLFGLIFWVIPKPLPTWLILVMGFLCLAILVWIQTINSRELRAARRLHSWAIIEPRTMTEFRDRLKADHRPRQANTIASISVGVAVVAAAIAVWAIYAPK